MEKHNHNTQMIINNFSKTLNMGNMQSLRKEEKSVCVGVLFPTQLLCPNFLIVFRTLKPRATL